MGNVYFWILWGLISLWVLKNFYFSYNLEKLERLRKTALGLNILIFISTIVSLVLSVNFLTGLEQFLTANILSIVFIILLFGSTILFLTKNSLNLKIASTASIINTFVYFVVVYNLHPETFIPNRQDVAQIIGMLLMLVNNVVVLLLWQQLQLKEKKSERKDSNRKMIFIISFILLSIALLFSISIKKPQEKGGRVGVEIVSKLPEVMEFQKEVKQNSRSTFGVEVGAKPSKEMPYYLIQVFEVFPDHRTTFAWYLYDPVTKTVTKETY